jgi:hypothetical protein
MLAVGVAGNQKPDFIHASTASTAAWTLRTHRNGMKPQFDSVLTR